MEAATTPSAIRSRQTLARDISWFLMPPITAGVLFCLLFIGLLALYESSHQERIYTGVYIGRADLSGLTRPEAAQALAGSFAYEEQPSIQLIDPVSGRQWQKTPAELGLYLDREATVAQAYQVGRSNNPLSALWQQLTAWYHGHPLSPIIVLDEGRLNSALSELAAEINRPPANAALHYDGSSVDFAPSQVGLVLDVADARERLIPILTQLQVAEVELLVHEIHPNVPDTSAAAQEIRQIISSPMTFYLQELLDDVDLDRVTLPTDELVRWLRIEMVTGEDGAATYNVSLDNTAARQWLAEYADLLRREPENARFYFDDDTEELVLVEPHVNGRALDIDVTLERFHEQVKTPNRSLPFALREIVPVVHSGATAEELGIVELVSQSTTWFYGSSAERRHNIARSAANFYGIVVAPGEEFSFNHYLGEISEEAGYETGLIIWGGRTIEGVGGGVCQVSTTLFQAIFWGGFPITERWPHGYRVGYYDDGEGPGMDAAIYSPLIDLRFINNTPHHLLIENYFSEATQSLTFKFYSTSMGRVVEKEGPVIENVIPPKPDVWELNEELAEGEIEQVDWAVEGSDVTVYRRVFNRDGDLMYGEERIFSRYIPWQNVYQYGPGTEIPGVTAPAEPEETPEPEENGSAEESP